MLRRIVAISFTLAAAAPVMLAGQNSVADTAIHMSLVDQMPERTGGRALRYPPMLLAAGIQGSVTVRYVIDEHGRTDRESIEVMESPSRSFTQAAKDYVRSSRFQPALKGGQPVKVLVEQVISFAPSGSRPTAQKTGNN